MDEFYDYLIEENGLSEKTADTHCFIIDMFNEFLTHQTFEIWDYSGVIKGMVNTYFKRWY